MGSGWKKAAALVTAAVMTCGALTGCGKKAEEKIDGTKTLMTVNGETMNLGVGSFLAKYTQAQTYRMYQQIYAMYGAQLGNEVFDGVVDEESGATYGENLKESILEDLKKYMVIRQHAEEYGVSLTDEEKKAIDEAADAYIASNSEEVQAVVGASRDDVAELMTLQTIQSRMMDPIVKDVDTEVSDEEGQISSLTYITVNVPEEEDVTSGTSSAEAAAEIEPVAEPETASTASGAESVAEEVEETALQLKAKATAQSVIDAILAEGGDLAEADLGAVAKTVDESLGALVGQFTTHDTSDATVDESVVKAVEGLADGTLVETPVLSDDGTKYYVVRFDKAYDESRTESNKSSIVRERKQEEFDTITEQWVEEAEITVDDKAWASVTITDLAPVVLAAAPEPETESTAESMAESVVSATDVEDVAEP